MKVFFGDELGKCSWWKWMFDTLTAETSFSVFGFMKGKEVSWQLSTTKHFLLYFLTAAQCYDLHALQKVLTEMESEIRICKVYTWKTFKGSGSPQKSPKLSKNQYTYLKTLSCVLYKNTEKYLYFIFKNTGIGIWVKSSYCQFSSNFCQFSSNFWSGRTCLKVLLHCKAILVLFQILS